MAQTFKAMIVEEFSPKQFRRIIGEKSTDHLPAGEVLIEVHYSSLNYKDALSATGNKGVTRTYPHTPGIDASGIVSESSDSRFSTGDRVLVTGYDLGMNTSGGFGQYIRVPGSWVVKVPERMTLKDVMAFGTAGLTAALSVYKFEQYGISPNCGEVLVTGASGGVGSMAVAILARLGYSVFAVSGKADQKDFLLKLGAKQILPRDEVVDTSGKPLLKARWAAAVDTVGGVMLSSAICSTQLNGIVTCCGNVASPDLNLTVFPFILRGISLLGIDSQNCSHPVRQYIWDKFSDLWKPECLAEMTREISLEDLETNISDILKGKLKGRTVVNLKK